MTARRTARKGFSLAALLVSSTLAFVVLWCMFSTSHYQVAFVRTVCDKDTARDWANAALLMAIEELKGDPDFSGQTYYDADPGPGQTAQGQLTFDPTSAPYSTNNLVSSVPVTGWKDTIVPPRTAHLVAVGRNQGQRVVMEALVSLPPFPYSVACEGSFASDGSLEVFSIDSVADLEDGVFPEEKKPGHIVSNSADAPAVKLSSATTVTGDVRTVGTIELETGATVANLLPGSSALVLPAISATDYDPTGLPYTYDYTPGETVAGRARHSGSLTLGDVELADGLLYVDGNLTINGVISGKGAIVCSGDLLVNGSMALSSDFAALVAGGDVTIVGVGPNSSSVQGIVYAGGSFLASDVRIVGPYLQADPDGGARLDNVISVSAPELTAITLDSATALDVNWGENDASPKPSSPRPDGSTHL